MKQVALQRRSQLARRTPLKRSGRLAPKRAIRKTVHLKSQRVEDPAYLAAVRTLRCVACVQLSPEELAAIPRWLRDAIEAHHSRTRPEGQNYGTRVKAPDDESLPLCVWHHRAGPKGHGFHNGPRSWRARFGGERLHVARTQAIVRPLLGRAGVVKEALCDAPDGGANSLQLVQECAV